MTPSSAPRVRCRSELATPASSEHMCAKAAASDADLVFLDLEDACVPAVKERSREIAISALVQHDWGSTRRAVRVNGLETPWCHDDVVEVVTRAGDAVDVLILPKIRSAREVWWFDVLLTQLETKVPRRRPIGVEVLIEEAEGLLNVQEIARSSLRLEALIFGAGDLSASLQARVDGSFYPTAPYPGDYWHYARVQILAAARSAGVRAIDAPYPPYQDPEGYRRLALEAAALGFDGKWAIHPSQVTIANEVFAPTREEIAAARATVDAYRAAEERGVGAIGIDGALVDAAHMRHAENIFRATVPPST